MNGFRTEVKSSPSGTETSRKKWAIVNGVAVLELLVSSEVYGDMDEFDRPQLVTHLNGRTETFSYACCGLETHVGIDAVTTTYGYDVLGRQDTITRLGITEKRDLDSAGRTVVEKRIGTDASQVTRRTITYDTAGFVTQEVNALAGSATYARTKPISLFDRIVTTYPDGGIRTEDFDAEGQVKVTGSAVFPARYVRGLTTTDYDGATRTFRSVQEIKLDAAGADTAEAVVTCRDGLDRVAKTIYPHPSGAAAYVYFNNGGQVIRQTDPDNVETLFRYNQQGELEVIAIDVDHDGQVANVDPGITGSDRVTKTVTAYLPAEAPPTGRGFPIRRVETTVWTTLNSAAEAKVSTLETSLDGLRSWQTVYKDQSIKVTTTTEAVFSGNTRTVTTTSAQGAYAISEHVNGRLITLTERALGGAQITQTTRQYDTHGRLWKSTDARNGTTTFGYNAADQLASTLSPVPGTGAGAQTVTTAFDTSLRPYLETQSDNTTVTREYFATGLLKKTFGARTYPVEYTYDAQGRMKTMTTWQNYPAAGAATTTWNYHASRAWLTSKVYHGQSFGTEYDYTAGSRLKTRLWARTGTGGRILTTYSYGFDDGASGNDHGDLLSMVYSNDPAGTPPVNYSYDRRGRRSTTTFNGMTTTHSYNDANLPSAESYSGGALNGLTVTLGYDAYLRRNSLGANTSTGISQSFAYDTASRLQTVTDGSFSSTYGYHPNSRLINTITHVQSGAARLTETRAYDFLNRLSSIQAVPSAGYQYAISFAYQYNDANQRTRATLAGGSYWVYQYDNLGQVVSGKKYWSDGNPVAGAQYEYGFDTIGNRLSSKAGGDQNGANLQTSTCTPNLLNQYNQRTVPGFVAVSGLADAAASVTANGQAAYRRNEYFWKELAVDNSANPVWQGLSIQSGNSTVAGNQFVPKTPEIYTSDPDGNLIADGRWSYTWDAENRLVRMVSATSVGLQQRLDFSYDSGGRRIKKTVWNNTAGSGEAASDLRFVYDGWNLIAELDAKNANAVLRSYVWGLDLSGTMQEAGGVGGLLAVHQGNANHFAAYDGNGNVAALVDGSTGLVSANYEYGPFGEAVRLTGTMGRVNPLRWSSKYTDEESGLSYYGYRYYAASNGRWLSRDPLEERGGLHLLGFVNNDPIGKIDRLGLEFSSIDGAIRTCMEAPTPALRIECLEKIFAGEDTIAQKKLRELIKRIGCNAVHAEYKVAESLAIGCEEKNPILLPGETLCDYVRKKLAARTEVVGRQVFLMMGCLNCKPDKVRTHYLELAEKKRALSKCASRAVVVCGMEGF